MKTVLVLLASAGALFAGAAMAQDISPEQVFAIVDANGDGAISFGEANAANSNVTQDVFARFDGDGNGSLSPAEFAALFANGPRPPGL